MPVKKVSKSMLSAPKEQEQVVESSPVEVSSTAEHTKTPAKQATSTSDALELFKLIDSEDPAPNEDDTLSNTERVERLGKVVKKLNLLMATLNRSFKDYERKVISKEKRLVRVEERKANNKKKGGSGGLKKLQRVYNEDFKSFVEAHYQSLYAKPDKKSSKGGSDDEGSEPKLILSELTYEDGHLMINREDSLSLVSSYVRQNGLQYEDNKRRIVMDDTLKTLFPTLAEHTAPNGDVVEEDCYFHTLMRGITRHMKTADELAEFDSQQEERRLAKSGKQPTQSATSTPANTPSATPQKAKKGGKKAKA